MKTILFYSVSGKKLLICFSVSRLKIIFWYKVLSGMKTVYELQCIWNENYFLWQCIWNGSADRSSSWHSCWGQSSYSWSYRYNLDVRYFARKKFLKRQLPQGIFPNGNFPNVQFLRAATSQVCPSRSVWPPCPS